MSGLGNGAALNGTSHSVSPFHAARKVTELLDGVRVAAPSEKMSALKLSARGVFGLSEAEHSFQDKVDRLWATAEAHGIVERYGSDAVQRALAEARADPIIEDEFSPRLDAAVPPITKRDIVLSRCRDVLLSRCAAQIAPEKIEWIWYGRLARGKHACAAGEPGGGKSTLAVDICARLTTGGEWPCGEGRAPIGNIIILSAEDGAADTIIPRLLAAGADLNRVHVVSAVRNADGSRRTLNLQGDLELLEGKIAEIGDVCLIVVDPVSSYLGKTDSHKNSEVRGVLEPLSEMAERMRVAILSVTHFSKSGANSTTKALHRFIGSIAFTGAPRMAFAVIEDAEQAGRHLLLHAKNNLAKAPQGLAYRIEQCLVGDGIVASRIVWDAEPVTITANEALAADTAGSHRSAKDEAAEWLRELLADGPLPAKQVRSEADAAGHSWATVKRAKQAGRIEHFREGGTADSGRWLWRLPAEESLTGSPQPYLAHDLNVSPLGNFEPVSERGAR
jgi:hypothetical protein